MSIPILLQQQNPDGGWPYRRGASWTEPTALAILATTGTPDPAVERGLHWLRAAQCEDGGWQARPGIAGSCWVTALAALVPADRLGAERHQRAIAWLLATTGVESTTLYRFRQWLSGNRIPRELSAPGWPWVPGTAAWVGPSCLALLALSGENQLRPTPALASRIGDSRHFLFNRMCKGGGWNHGSVRALGYESGPYPETTGMALAALRGVAGAETEQSLALALRFLNECRSADALNWLRLGLAAHNRLPAGYSAPAGIAPRTVPEIACGILAAAAAAGKCPLWT